MGRSSGAADHLGIALHGAAAGPNIGMLATDGKVALVQHANPLPASQCLEQGSNGIVDFVGYGNAICFEGGGPAAATSTGPTQKV